MKVRSTMKGGKWAIIFSLGRVYHGASDGDDDDSLSSPQHLPLVVTILLAALLVNNIVVVAGQIPSSSNDSIICVYIDAAEAQDRPEIVPYFLSRLDSVDRPKEKLFVYFDARPIVKSSDSSSSNVGQQHHQQRVVEYWNQFVSSKSQDYGRLRTLVDPDVRRTTEPAHLELMVMGVENCEYLWSLSVDFLLANSSALENFINDRTTDLSDSVVRGDDDDDEPSVAGRQQFRGCSLLRLRANDDRIENAEATDLSTLVKSGVDCSSYEMLRAKKCRKMGIISKRDDLRYDLVSLLDCMNDDLLPDRSVFPALSSSSSAWFDNNDGSFDSLDDKQDDVVSGYLISLARRPNRRRKALKALSLLGLRGVVVDAVDGQTIEGDGDDWLAARGLSVMDNYTCPVTGRRTLTKGEIGCLLSHVDAWRQIAESRTSPFAAVFEDDARFMMGTDTDTRRFDSVLAAVLKEARELVPDWDLIYLGRKHLTDTFDPVKIVTRANGDDVEAEYLHTVPYTHWAVGYLLSKEGARKLLRPELLTNMIPSDEYLPLMYDQHPNDEWKSKFPIRDLKAFCVEPAIVEPSLYPGDDGYVTDTENSAELGAQQQQ